jgi:EmrB/QacA subfamily drug resistance transporter
MRGALDESTTRARPTDQAAPTIEPVTRPVAGPTGKSGPPAAALLAVAAPDRWFVSVLVLVVGNFMAVLDVTIVNVAVPAIQKDFGGSLDDVLWIATAYTLMLGVVVPLSGWLGDRFGLTKVYMGSLLGFAVGSALCGIAWNLDTLIAFRILQAVFGGIMPVVAMTLLYRIVPPVKIGVAMGIFGIGTVFAPATGPVLGGYLVEYFNWRLVFYLNVPIGILGAIASFMVLPKLGAAAARRFDVAGFVCVAFGLFAVLLAVSEGSTWGWTSYPVLILLAAGVNSLVLFVLIELQVEQPLLDLRTFKVRQFSNSLVLLAVLQVNLLAISFYVPVFLQQGQGMQAFDAGLLMLPQAVVMGVLMPIVGRVYDRIGPRWVSVIGLAVCAYGTFLLCGTTTDLTRADIIMWTCVRGIGMGLALMTIMTAGLGAVPPAQTNQASALNNVARQVSGALGLAVYSAMSTAQQAQLMANRSPLLTESGPTVDPRVLAMEKQGPAGLLPLWQQLQLHVAAEAYGNIFLITAATTGAGVVLALFLRTRSGGGRHAIDI